MASEGSRFRARGLGVLLCVSVVLGLAGCAPVAPAADAPAAKPTLDLSLMLAERLLHLLGGEVRASPAGYPNRLESLTIKLPTSHPEETRRIGLCRECPETLQALEYAKELATRI